VKPEEFDFCCALKISERVFNQYKEDQLKWWKRMDGTPILNDVAVRMATAFMEEFHRLLARCVADEAKPKDELREKNVVDESVSRLHGRAQIAAHVIESYIRKFGDLGKYEGTKASDHLRRLDESIDAMRSRSEGVREGWQLVPIEPTGSQILAAHNGPLLADDHEPNARTIQWIIDMYKAMLAAAPSPGEKE
jgi:hypothetical protein